jgi:hypothetical protein
MVLMGVVCGLRAQLGPFTDPNGQSDFPRCGTGGSVS